MKLMGSYDLPKCGSSSRSTATCTRLPTSRVITGQAPATMLVVELPLAGSAAGEAEALARARKGELPIFSQGTFHVDANPHKVRLVVSGQSPIGEPVWMNCLGRSRKL